MAPRLWEFLTAPLGIKSHERAMDAADQNSKQYYEGLNRSKLSKDLADTLGKLFDNHKQLIDIFKQTAVIDGNGQPRWREDNFRTWVTTNQSLPMISGFLPTLWRVFVYFAKFPFSETTFYNREDSSSEVQYINENGFVQAYNLLAMRGVELVGTSKTRWTPSTIEGNWSKKLPQLTSLIFDGLKIQVPGASEPANEVANTTLTKHAEEQLVNAITLAQPMFYPWSSLYDERLRQAAKRIFTDNSKLNHNKTSPFIVSKLDLQTFIQLSLLLHVDIEPRKRGLRQHSTQMSEDIERPSLMSHQGDIDFATELAKAFIQHTLGNKNPITWPSIETICKAHPNLILRFYQVWTALCVRQTSTSLTQNPGSGVSNCIFQFLSLFGVVDLDDLALDSEFKEAERQVEIDLRGASIVASSATGSALDGSWLDNKYASENRFHFLILSTEDEVATVRLFALFINPRGKKMSLSSPAGILYVWRYGLVQLLPQIVTAQPGGLAASVQSNNIRFSPHHSSGSEISNVVDINLKESTVVVELPGSPSLHLKVKSLNCYQLVGNAVTVISSSHSKTAAA